MHHSSIATGRQVPSYKTVSNTNVYCISIQTTRILGIALLLSIMVVLKYHYHIATADQLRWILGPTAELLSWFTSVQPVFENGVGYVDFAKGIIVAPACAGINFMVMAFGLMALCCLIRARRPVGIPAWLLMSLITAYGCTLMVNTLRIGISMILYNADIYNGWWTVERVHRLVGIGLYLGGLWVLFSVVELIYRRHRINCSKSGCRLPSWFPFGWYVLIAVGIPLVRLLYLKHAPQFGEHICTVLFTVLCMWALASVLEMLVKRA